MLEIVTMTLTELEMVIGWAAEEGWNPGTGDAAAFHAADPEGFFIGRVGGEPAAAISVVNHDAANAFLGLYICRPPFRGQGHGFALWTHALRHAGTRAVGLDGVPAQQANYRRSGFQPLSSTLRHEGTLAGRDHAGVRPFTLADRAAVGALDRAANGVDRPRFLDAWTAAVDGRQTLVLEAGGAVTGFCTARTCRTGIKIGPVVAPDTASAVMLIEAAAARLPARPLVIDVPEGNAALRRVLEGWGFTVTFGTARMVRGTPPATGPGLQAIATMELG